MAVSRWLIERMVVVEGAGVKRRAERAFRMPLL
jgi:hypothetical protein